MRRGRWPPAGPPSGPGRLLLGLNRGSELFEVKVDGPYLLRRRVASEAEIAALDRASQALADTLASRGLDVRVVAAKRDRRKIDVVPEPAWDCPAETRIGELRTVMAGRLRQCGFTDIRDVVRLGAQLAAQCGLSDARVAGDANYVEIGLTDTPDSMRDILALLARAGIGPGLVLAVGVKPGPRMLPMATAQCCAFGRRRYREVTTRPGPSLIFPLWAGDRMRSCACLTSSLLRDVDHEDVRDADLGDVLAVENPAGRVRRGWMVLGLSRVVLRVSR